MICSDLSNIFVLAHFPYKENLRDVLFYLPCILILNVYLNRLIDLFLLLSSNDSLGTYSLGYLQTRSGANVGLKPRIINIKKWK